MAYFRAAPFRRLIGAHARDIHAKLWLDERTPPTADLLRSV
jgi:hypothetical protein